MSKSRLSVFVGIDAAIAKQKRLPICVCTVEKGQLTPLPIRELTKEKPPAGRGNKVALTASERTAFAAEVVSWLGKLESDLSLKIERIAIDAPSDYAVTNRRACERDMDACKISCFATPTKTDFDKKIREAEDHLKKGLPEAKLPNANQIWMLVGFSLFRELEKKYECIEVFPQAIVHVLGCTGGHKSTSVGFDYQIKKIAAATGQSEHQVRDDLKTLGYGSSHDRLDALMSAWVASLPESKRRAYGNPPDDAIWVPR